MSDATRKVRLVGGPFDGKEVEFSGYLYEVYVQQDVCDPPEKWGKAIYDWHHDANGEIIGVFNRVVPRERPAGCDKIEVMPSEPTYVPPHGPAYERQERHWQAAQRVFESLVRQRMHTPESIQKACLDAIDWSATLLSNFEIYCEGKQQGGKDAGPKATG